MVCARNGEYPNLPIIYIYVSDDYEILVYTGRNVSKASMNAQTVVLTVIRGVRFFSKWIAVRREGENNDMLRITMFQRHFRSMHIKIMQYFKI